jgi:hypothetical protein
MFITINYIKTIGSLVMDTVPNDYPVGIETGWNLLF